MKFKPTFGDIDPADLETNETSVSAIDYGLDFGAGIHFEPMLIKVGYSMGFGNLTTGIDGLDYEPSDDYEANKVFYVSLTYFLQM